MFFAIVTLVTALSMAAVAAWFAIAGIMAIFAGMPIFALIMGIVVEAGKVVGVTWVYRNWLEKTKLKLIMIPVVIVAMLLTSMGIFGLLSKAHLEQTAPVSSNSAKIERLDLRIGRERAEIADAVLIIAQLDETIQVLVDAKKISHPVEGSRVVRINQQPQRDQLKQIIDNSFDSIDEYEDEKLTLNQELNELELEVGPVKYLAALVYEDPQSRLDETVRMVIIAFIFVFDPMAILLLMAANFSFMQLRGKEPTPSGGSSEPEDSDDPPGEDLINLIDDDENSTQTIVGDVSKLKPVDTVQVKLENGLYGQPTFDREWINDVPTKDEEINSDELIQLIHRLRHRDRTADENLLLERFKTLAAKRNIPWDVAKRATVSTRNELLKH